MTRSPHAAEGRRVRIGALCWSQQARWERLEEAGIRADRLGYDSIWTWDHLVSMGDRGRSPILEGWLVMAALAACTSQARLGLMVSANTFRNPALVAKMATTVDHISGGRFVLGIGGAWYEEEHASYGFEFGASYGERLRWLEEAVQVIRPMLDGERASGTRHYGARGAVNSPRPLQDRLPILIGGGGERRTLRIVARFADAWNVTGLPDVVRRKDEVLRRHCLEVGRDESEIERTVGLGVVVIRERSRDARRAFGTMLGENGVTGVRRFRNTVGRLVAKRRRRTWSDRFVGTPEEVAERVRPYVEAGFRHLIAGYPYPHDPESMERFATEVRPLL